MQNATAINSKKQTQPIRAPIVADREEMRRMLQKDLGNNPELRLPKPMPDNIIKANFHGAGKLYPIKGKNGDTIFVNHAELKVLHELVEEIKRATDGANASAQQATIQN
jgi:hypothetical protein